MLLKHVSYKCNIMNTWENVYIRLYNEWVIINNIWTSEYMRTSKYNLYTPKIFDNTFGNVKISNKQKRHYTYNARNKKLKFDTKRW